MGIIPHKKGLMFRTLAFSLVFTLWPPGAKAQEDIGQIRERFEKSIGQTLSGVKDFTAAYQVTTRLPSGRPLLQKSVTLALEGKVRQEVVAEIQKGSALRFTTIDLGDDVWTITPNGQTVKMESGAHGGVRPDPVKTYMDTRIASDARLVKRSQFLGRKVYVVDNAAQDQVLWLDENDMTVLKIQTSRPLEGEMEWVFFDFRHVKGAGKLPWSINYGSGNAQFSFRVVTLEVNGGLDEALFDPERNFGR